MYSNADWIIVKIKVFAHKTKSSMWVWAGKNVTMHREHERRLSSSHRTQRSLANDRPLVVMSRNKARLRVWLVWGRSQCFVVNVVRSEMTRLKKTQDWANVSKDADVILKSTAKMYFKYLCKHQIKTYKLFFSQTDYERPIQFMCSSDVCAPSSGIYH